MNRRQVGSADVDTPGQRKRTASQGSSAKTPESEDKEVNVRMAKEYTGRISQTGSQVVKAPAQLAPRKSGGKVKKGEDLRTNKK